MYKLKLPIFTKFSLHSHSFNNMTDIYNYICIVMYISHINIYYIISQYILYSMDVSFWKKYNTHHNDSKQTHLDTQKTLIFINSFYKLSLIQGKIY